MDNAMLLQLLAALIGSLGYAILQKVRGRQIVFAGIGGVASWGVYLLAYNLVKSYFLATLIAAIFVAIYAEIMARVNRAPSTIFLTTCAVPLIPGSNLYNTVYGLVTQDYDFAYLNAVTAIVVALGICFGFIMVTVIMKLFIRDAKGGQA